MAADRRAAAVVASRPQQAASALGEILNAGEVSATSRFRRYRNCELTQFRPDWADYRFAGRFNGRSRRVWQA
jgi:hypothetical protein